MIIVFSHQFSILSVDMSDTEQEQETFVCDKPPNPCDDNLFVQRSYETFVADDADKDQLQIPY
jgi:hypothetical protein